MDHVPFMRLRAQKREMRELCALHGYGREIFSEKCKIPGKQLDIPWEVITLTDSRTLSENEDDSWNRVNFGLHELPLQGRSDYFGHPH